MTTKSKLLVAAILVVLALVTFLGRAFPQTTTTPSQSQTEFFYGVRLASDMQFHLIAGTSFGSVDVGAGLGFNNGVWLGIHTFFFDNGEIAVFTGMELSVLYPQGEPLELHPQLPIGFGVLGEGTMFILETLLVPVVPEQQVQTTFAFAFTMEL